jgi:antitoxin HicB
MSEVLVPLQIERLPEGYYLASSEALPGLVAQGRTVEETVDIARDVARKLMDSYSEHGDPLPSAIRPVEMRMDLLAAVGR